MALISAAMADEVILTGWYCSDTETIIHTTNRDGQITTPFVIELQITNYN